MMFHLMTCLSKASKTQARVKCPAGLGKGIQSLAELDWRVRLKVSNNIVPIELRYREVNSPAGLDMGINSPTGLGERGQKGGVNSPEVQGEGSQKTIRVRLAIKY